jgi:serine protease Do
MKSKILTVFSIRVVVTVVLTLLLAVGYSQFQRPGAAPFSSAHAATITAPPAARAAVTLPDFAEIVAQQGPAVVNVSVSSKVKTMPHGFPGSPQMDPDDPFYEFFHRFQIPAPHGEIPAHGLGSGFIVSADGYVLTNAHVVDGADEVTVKLTDKREFKARVKGVDKLADVAVLKIDARNLPTVKIGDPQQSRVGEWVIAIGSPFGFENSVTAGIISAKSRTLPDEGYVPFLQTDVAVNPGNSGGPLFNTNGEVIGINSQIYSRSGGYQGLSFAIPIDVAMKVERQLVEYGKVSRGRLGVYIQEMNQQLADTFGLDNPRGALVSSVEKDSPAEKAGIESGDIILKFNGKEISRSAELPALVADLAPGVEAKLELWHKGKSREISLAVGEMQSSPQARAAKQSNDKLGLSVRPLSPEESKRAGVSGGLLAEDVDQGGPAASAGIRPGDIILSVNGDKVGSADEMHTLIGKHRKQIALLILRNKQRMFVPIDLG